MDALYSIERKMVFIEKKKIKENLISLKKQGSIVLLMLIQLLLNTNFINLRPYLIAIPQ